MCREAIVRDEKRTIGCVFVRDLRYVDKVVICNEESRGLTAAIADGWAGIWLFCMM